MSPRTVAGVALATVFGLLALLHVAWAFGWFSTGGGAIPELQGKPVFVPGRVATLAVAVALLAAATVALAQAGLILTGWPRWIPRLGAIGLGCIMVLRAIGDFRLIGFFKSVRGTQFATLDSWAYSPLCLALGVTALWLAYEASSGSVGGPRAAP
ncbi:MAG: DUF3995 domain-containing protein [Acidobacteriota bacterium]